MSKTLVVNLFGAPSAGKSTGAAYIFYQLKSKGINAEYVSEFAKDKVWEENDAVFKDQNYMFGKQSFKLSRVNGKVDVIVTDSPLPLSAFYSNDECREQRQKLIFTTFGTYNNLNYFIERAKKYNPAGRFQTEAESDAIGVELEDFLYKNNIDFVTVAGVTGGYDTIVDDVLARLNK